MGLNWNNLTEAEQKSVLECVDKSRMHELPPEILGHYCALDADATYLLYKSQFEGLLQRFKAYEEYHRGPFMNLERLLQAQMLTGIRIKKSQLVAFASELARDTAALRRRFLSLPNVQEGVQQINRAVYDTMKSEEPPRYKKQEKLGEEPPKHTVLGLVSKTWQKWEAKRLRLESTPPEERKDWQRWNERISRVGDALFDYASFPEEEAKELGLFNMASPLQKAQLFYDVLGFDCIVWTKPEDGKEPQRSTDADAMLGFGEAGEAYTDFSEKEKLLQMITSCLENLVQHNEDFPCDKDGEWYLHPQVKVPGTLTGRLSGSGGINVQNFPKERGYLECFTHRDRHCLLQADAAGLEPVVLAELSRDESMLKLYGPDAKANDVYIFNAMAFPGIGDKFRSCGYDPDSPTKEAIDACKKQYKPLRQLSKLASLSAAYGAGPAAWRAKFALEGFNYSLSDCKEMHKAYWELYKGVKKWERHLEALWEKNGGWVLNGVGRPVCIDKMFLKDKANRVVQSTGHCILLFMLDIMTRIARERGLRIRPWIVDQHDEFYFEILQEDAEMYKSVVKEAEGVLKKMLGGVVTIKWEPTIVHTIAEAKLE